MERAAGERFDRLMARLVLEPLGLDACFNWTTCSDAALARAVVLYEPDGSVIRDDLGGRRPACPVLAPDGVPATSTATRSATMARSSRRRAACASRCATSPSIGRLLLNRGRHGGRALPDARRASTRC